MAVLALWGCSKNETERKADFGEPLQFSSYAARSGQVQDKADGSFVPSNSAVFPSGTSFSVFSWYDGATTPYHFFNQSVLCTVTAGVASYSYSPTQYWPSAGEMDFWAFYPHGSANISHLNTGGTAFSRSDEGYGVLDFSVPAAASSQTDLMLADRASGLTYDNTVDGTVPLTFHHMLTQVQFKAKKSDNTADISVTDVTVLYAYSHGVLAPAGTATSSSWTSRDTDNVPFPVVSSPVALTTSYASLTSSPLLMIPQSLSAVKVRIGYSCTTGGRTVAMEPVEYSLSTNEITAWQQGNSIVYNLEFSVHPITITPELVEWRTAAASVTID